MSPSRLVRVVVRTEPGLHEALARIAQRLFSETQLQYSRAAVFRGLVAIGLAAISDAPHLAPLFRGVRVKRGRKPGGPGGVTQRARRSRRPDRRAKYGGSGAVIRS